VIGPYKHISDKPGRVNVKKSASKQLCGRADGKPEERSEKQLRRVKKKNECAYANKLLRLSLFYSAVIIKSSLAFLPWPSFILL
jgi:hypothetical protein